MFDGKGNEDKEEEEKEEREAQTDDSKRSHGYREVIDFRMVPFSSVLFFPWCVLGMSRCCV